MADKKRILIVSQEMKPYTKLSELSALVNRYALYLQENNMEVRILMPRFGTINERRHRLHEVVRLSGMNINIDEEDYPLIIKVASLPGARMQVYFLDNEDFFKRKQVFADADDKLFEDNIDRSLFFCKGVVETVKKFGWAPDVVHTYGWMLGFLPPMLKTTYADEPIFQNAKVVYTASDCQPINEAFETNFGAKAKANGLEGILDNYIVDGKLNINKGASSYADGTIVVPSEGQTSIDGIEQSGMQFEDDFSIKSLAFHQDSLVEAD
jgi:starch synthase